MYKKILPVLGILCILSGCSFGFQDPESALSSVRYVSSMDTEMTLQAYGKNREAALDAAQAEILRLNDLLSNSVEGSDTARVNRDRTAVVSADAAAVTQQALALYESTEGLFDITTFPLSSLWGFYEQKYHVPTLEELESTLSLVDGSKVQLNMNTAQISLGENQSIDLGGIAKGYTSNRIMEIFREHGVTSALVSLGGNVQCLGAKPNGTPWNIGITNPWKKNSDIYAAVKVVDKAVITSGGYERFFTDPQTGEVYRHILDPRTGYPAQSGLSSVSIITPDGTLGDGLSTSLYIMGLEKAWEYWRAHSTQFEAILIADDGTLYVTEGLKDSVSSTYPIQILTK